MSSLSVLQRAGAEAAWMEETSTRNTSGHERKRELEAQRPKIQVDNLFSRSGPQGSLLRMCLSAVDTNWGRNLTVALQGKGRKDKYEVKDA